MGVYYNRTQSPVPVTLSGGRAILIQAKGREILHGEDESAPALLQAIGAQKIVRLPDAYASKIEGVGSPVAAVVPAVAPVVAEAPAPAPVVVAAPAALSIETQNGPALSDDGSSTGTAAAAPSEQGTRVDGPRRERRK
jgi:hypothetical protein